MTWTTKWPTEEGWYWCARRKRKTSIDDSEKRTSDLKPVEVRYAGSGNSRFWIYIAGGHFIHPEEEELGDFQVLWKRMENQPVFPENFDELVQ